VGEDQRHVANNDSWLYISKTGGSFSRIIGGDGVVSMRVACARTPISTNGDMDIGMAWRGWRNRAAWCNFGVMATWRSRVRGVNNWAVGERQNRVCGGD